MNLYALKSAAGYLKIDDDSTYTIVGINKASVYDDAKLPELRARMGTLKDKLADLRVVKLVLMEEDYYIC